MVATAKELPRDTKNTIFITFDATKDIKSQKAEINKQINSQLKNHDGNGRIAVNKEILAQDFSRPEDQGRNREQSAKITSLMNHISREVYNKTKAKFISTNDEIKIVHPEQRQAGETKAVLANDTNKQSNNNATAKAEIKQDKKEIVQIKSGRRR